jgi:ATP-binding cassette subfamily G (WHITE) protein 2 (SNQ2)
MEPSPRPTPLDSDIPGGWIETPAEPSRQQSFIGSQYTTEYTTEYNNTEDVPTPRAIEHTEPTFISNAFQTSSGSFYGGTGAGLFTDSNHSTAVPSPQSESNADVHNSHAMHSSVLTEIHEPSQKKDVPATPTESSTPQEEAVEKLEAVESDSPSDHDDGSGYAAIKSAEAAPARPHLNSRPFTQACA